MKKQNESVEKLEEPKIHIKEAIKENTVIHCETEEEAKRILGMAHELGYKWHTGENYEPNPEWNIYKSTMCYYLFDGSYSEYDYFKNRNYTIIPSTQIANVEEKKSTGWTPAPEDIKEMKKYRLKKWYPSLDENWDPTHRYEYQSSTGYMCNKSMQHCVIIYKKELHSDFWEEVEEPLFVTEDGVDIFLGHSYILIDKEFIKHKQTASNIVYTEYFKKFKHESNADEYIVKNKPVFSYEDFIRWGNVPYERVIMQLAKERIEV